MLSALLRPLVLTAGLLLLLPPGWCCLLAGVTQPPVSAGRSATPSEHACCGHCGSKSAKSSRPIPGHVPGRDGKCPCGERTANAPGAPVNAGPDLSLPAPVAVTGCVTGFQTVAAYETTAAQLHPPHFHLLHCVWLC
jgi:hypothetical protein